MGLKSAVYILAIVCSVVYVYGTAVLQQYPSCFETARDRTGERPPCKNAGSRVLAHVEYTKNNKLTEAVYCCETSMSTKFAGMTERPRSYRCKIHTITYRVNPLVH